MNVQLVRLIRELQSLQVLDSFALAGGTNLAIRFDHRRSDDIDLFTDVTVGVQGWQKIQEEILKHFGNSVIYSEILNADEGEQFCFLRCLIRNETEQIKVDLIQNIQHLDPFEIYDDIKMFSVKDIGLFKLMTTANRKAAKDVYDLDLITDLIEPGILLKFLKEKTIRFNEQIHKCLFDLDKQNYPFENVSSLLEFDDAGQLKHKSKHTHSTDRIEVTNGKSWILARSNFKRKIKRLIKEGF